MSTTVQRRSRLLRPHSAAFAFVLQESLTVLQQPSVRVFAERLDCPHVVIRVRVVLKPDDAEAALQSEIRLRFFWSE